MEIYDPAHGDYLLDPENKINYHHVTIDLQQYSQNDKKVKMEYHKHNLSDYIDLNIDFILPLG